MSSAPRQSTRSRIDFSRVNGAALPALSQIVPVWLPNGRRVGAEWVALNPRRRDHRPGSFKINLRTGCWADFATGDRGGDVISLLAYLRDIPQLEATRLIARQLGLR